MSTTTVRVTQSVHDVLRTLAHDEGSSVQAVLEKAVEGSRRQRLLKEANAAYSTLRNDPEAWSEELEERRSWEATLADDLEAEQRTPFQKASHLLGTAESVIKDLGERHRAYLSPHSCR